MSKRFSLLPVSSSLTARLVLYSALASAVMVAATFAALHLSVRGHTRGLLAGTLSQHQRMLAQLEQQGLRELLRTSSLMSASPTLLAAMDTFRAEAVDGSEPRADLLATIQVEVEKIAGGLDPDLLIVTGPDGRVLARAGRVEDLPKPGYDLSGRQAVGHALAQTGPVGAGNFSVLRLSGSTFQVGSVPILLQGFIAGSLTLGERIDQKYVDRLHDSFGSEVVVVSGGTVIGSTLPSDAGVSLPDPGVARDRPVPGGEAEALARIAGEEFVTAMVPIGVDEEGRPVSLYLLRSLTGALTGENRSLLLILGGYGLLLVLVTGVSASVVSRSVLRPLASLVGFMRASAASGDRSGRFEAPRAGTEVRLLAATFNHMMSSLQKHEDRLVEKAREEIERLERLKESEKLAELGRMLSGAAHEINNPMTGVIGHVELLLQKQGLDETVKRRLEEVRRQGHRVVSLTRSLLKVARRDEGQRAPVDVNQVVSDAIALRRRDFERGGLTIEEHLHPVRIRIIANELELSQVFLNLVNNAYDALKEAGGKRTLSVRTSDDGDGARIVVEDDGPGLKDPSRVFEYFYTTKPLGQGTGLGLGICKAIVDRHQGSISAENRPGGGARFTVTLPRGEQTSVPAPAGDTASSIPVSRRPLPATVLVVDDEPVVRELQMAILDSLGAHVVSASSGAEAIEQLRKRDFDLIVADLMADTETPGKALYEWIRRNRTAGTQGVVFVSADGTGGGFIEEARARCLSKPFEMEDYVSMLREAWDEARGL